MRIPLMRLRVDVQGGCYLADVIGTLAPVTPSVKSRLCRAHSKINIHGVPQDMSVMVNIRLGCGIRLEWGGWNVVGGISVEQRQVDLQITASLVPTKAKQGRVELFEETEAYTCHKRTSNYSIHFFALVTGD